MLNNSGITVLSSGSPLLFFGFPGLLSMFPVLVAERELVAELLLEFVQQ